LRSAASSFQPGIGANASFFCPVGIVRQRATQGGRGKPITRSPDGPGALDAGPSERTTHVDSSPKCRAGETVDQKKTPVGNNTHRPHQSRKLRPAGMPPLFRLGPGPAVCFLGRTDSQPSGVEHSREVGRHPKRSANLRPYKHTPDGTRPQRTRANDALEGSRRSASSRRQPEIGSDLSGAPTEGVLAATGPGGSRDSPSAFS